MSFSNATSRHIVPLLARVVLCLVFVPIGWGMVMAEEEFSGTELTTLQELNVLENTTQEADSSSETNQARRVNHIAIALHAHGVPNPVLLAWVIVLVALIGGGLILIGLFTRLWALGLAGIMATVIGLESVPAICAAQSVFTLDTGILSTAAASLALGVLAIGLLLTGAGVLSLDAAIFSHKHHHRHNIDDEDDEEE